MKLQTLTLPMLLIGLLLWSLDFSPAETPSKLDGDFAQCHATTQAFAAFGSDQTFLDAHATPYEFHLNQEVGEMISFPTADGQDANAFKVTAKKPANNQYLFVIHEWYGLNDYVKNESQKIASRFPEMTVIALDMYDGKVAKNSDEASKYMQAVKTERALAIIDGAKTYVGEDAEIFTLGWCFGGGWSLQAAIELGSAAKGAVMFYGMPENDMDRLGKLKCDVLAIFANKDKWITPEVAATFKENMAKIDPKLTLKAYDADHGFANPSNPNFNEEAAEDAYKLMFKFLKAHR